MKNTEGRRTQKKIGSRNAKWVFVCQINLEFLQEDTLLICLAILYVSWMMIIVSMYKMQPNLL